MATGCAHAAARPLTALRDVDQLWPLRCRRLVSPTHSRTRSALSLPFRAPALRCFDSRRPCGAAVPGPALAAAVLLAPLRVVRALYVRYSRAIALRYRPLVSLSPPTSGGGGPLRLASAVPCGACFWKQARRRRPRCAWLIASRFLLGSRLARVTSTIRRMCLSFFCYRFAAGNFARPSLR